MRWITQGGRLADNDIRSRCGQTTHLEAAPCGQIDTACAGVNPNTVNVLRSHRHRYVRAIKDNIPCPAGIIIWVAGRQNDQVLRLAFQYINCRAYLEAAIGAE